MTCSDAKRKKRAKKTLDKVDLLNIIKNKLITWTNISMFSLFQGL